MIQNAQLEGSEGRPIVYDLLLQKKKAPLLILVHGFKSYKNWGAYDVLAQYFFDQGISVCKFNFSHNGGTIEQVIDFPDLEAFGQNTLSKEMDDLQVIIDDLLTDTVSSSTIDQDNITLVGHSRGGSIAALTAIEDPRIGRLVTLNAVADLHDHFERFNQNQWRRNGVLYIKNGRTKQDMPLYLSLLEDYERQKERFDILNRVTEMQTPILIIHCKDDEAVPVQQAIALDRLVSNSELLLLNEGGHTLGAKQPWEEKELPRPLRYACDCILAFMEKQVN